MDDRWREADDFKWQDAVHVVEQQHGCQDCTNYPECEALGACSLYLDQPDPMEQPERPAS